MDVSYEDVEEFLRKVFVEKEGLSAKRVQLTVGSYTTLAGVSEEKALEVLEMNGERLKGMPGWYEINLKEVLDGS